MQRAAIALGLTAWLAGSSPASGQNSSVISRPTITSSNVQIQWTGGGVLQSSPSVTGPWTIVASNVNAQSSASLPLSAVAQFVRTVQLGTPSDPVAILPDTPGTPFSPLKITSATIRLLTPRTPAGNAVLAMQVSTNQPPGTNRFQLLTDDTTVTTFRDDAVFPDTVAGDLVFSAVVELDTNALVAANSQLNNLLPSQRFNLTQDKLTRRTVSTNTVTSFDITNLMTGAAISILHPSIIKPCQGIAGAYDWRKTCMINNLSVVQDTTRTWDPCPAGTGTGNPAGVWTFGFLMEQICNKPMTGIEPSDFVKNWLESFDVARPINTDVVPANASVRSLILNPWLAASLAGGKPAGVLDLRKAPFRLLAIVNRLDLAGNTAYGAPSAKNPCDPPCINGESRFVFCATDQNCLQIPFLVILEYCNPGACREQQALAQSWANLNTFATFNAAYRTALEAITATFSLANAIPGRPPNKSALNQLRVNEFLGGGAWRLYEFKLAANGTDAGHLRPSTVAQTPDFAHNGVFNLGALPSTIPLMFNASHILGGWAPISAPPWDGVPPILPFPNRHKFGMKTCNGCHGSEAPTNPFTHVGCRDQGDEAALSQFLTGRAIWPDPITGGNVGPFNDLDNRVQVLNRIAVWGCGFSRIFHDTTVFVDPSQLVRPFTGNMGVFAH